MITIKLGLVYKRPMSVTHATPELHHAVFCSASIRLYHSNPLLGQTPQGIISSLP